MTSLSTCASIVALSALLACAGAAGAARAQPDGAGISVDRYRRMFPPAPVNVRVALRDGKAVVTWDKPPPPPPGKIGYDPVVESYRIYQVDATLNRTLLGETRDTSFEDSTPLPAGDVRHYAVTAVQRSGVESGMSQQATLRAPNR